MKVGCVRQAVWLLPLLSLEWCYLSDTIRGQAYAFD
jgi:hypothetical protein